MLAKIYNERAKQQSERYSSLNYQIPVVEYICNMAAHNGQYSVQLGFKLEGETIDYLLGEGFKILNLNPNRRNNFSYHIIKW